jgi:cholesterol 7-desaturase
LSKLSGAGPLRADLAVGNQAPLPYPSGWFCLAYSRELPAGAVVTKRFMGQDVVLYRTMGGILRAVSAHCPHLGAHLGAGGRVEGEHLVCPFHRFAFDAEGSCTSTPNGAVLRAKLGQFPVRERNKIVYVWHGHDSSEPSWELPAIPEDRFASTAFWSALLPSHPQEIMENLVDYRHFLVVHGIPVNEVAPPAEEGPLLRVHLRAAFRVFSGLATGTVDQPVVSAGLGQAVSEGAVRWAGINYGLWIMPTPIEPWQTRLHLVVAATAAVPRTGLPRLRQAVTKAWSAIVTQALLRAFLHVERQDVPIWTYKRYQPRPMLAPGDQAIGRYRRWARQFYAPDTPPSSPPAPDPRRAEQEA